MPRHRSESLLIWLNLFLAVLCLIPCCVVHQFPLLVDFIVLKVRPDLPEEGMISAAQLYGLPFGVMYGIQLALVGLPALLATIFLWRRSPLGWWFALATGIDQALLFTANTFGILLLGPFAVKGLGALVAFPLYAFQLTLLAANFFLIAAVPRPASDH